MKKEMGRRAGHNVRSIRLKTGDKFFNFTAVRKAELPQMWVFRCDCGNEVTMMAKDVIAGFRTHCEKCRSVFATNEERDPKKLGEQVDKSYGIDLFIHEGEKNAEKLRRRDPNYRRAHENGKSIMAIAKKAQEEGLTYGEYVRKHGL